MFRNNEMFRDKERMGVRMYIDKMFERATIKGIADYLLFGIGPDEDNRSYEERLEEPFRRFEKAVAKYDRVRHRSCLICQMRLRVKWRVCIWRSDAGGDEVDDRCNEEYERGKYTSDEEQESQ